MNPKKKMDPTRKRMEIMRNLSCLPDLQERKNQIGQEVMTILIHNQVERETAATIRRETKRAGVSRNTNAETALTKATIRESLDQRRIQVSTKNSYIATLLLFALFLTFPLNSVSAKCVGRFVNPITDICWKCIFPLRIMGVAVMSGRPDPDRPSVRVGQTSRHLKIKR